jgi:hypothetical protein
MTNTHDRLTQSELPAGDKPAQVRERVVTETPWHGSAAGQVNHWRARAEWAEAEVVRLRAIADASRSQLADALDELARLRGPK